MTLDSVVDSPIVEQDKTIGNESVSVSVSATASASASVSDSGKLQGRKFYESLGKPTKIVAPMVDGSELAWRIISRKYGAELCYSPMMHSRLFATDEKYRNNFFGPQDGDIESDRPLIVQFCANDPEYLLKAAKFVEDRCDAVDINFGCPQGIAKKGHYGSFLMDDWDLVSSLISKLHNNLKIPVTAKIRVFDDWEKSLKYAKICLNAGAQFLTVHGRTRDMKGQKTGFANWELLKYLRDNLPKDTVFFSNGNILYPDDINRCISNIGCDAVMSAEGNLCNPGVFWTKTQDKDLQFPRVDKFVREYFEIAKNCKGIESKRCFKTHLFKCLKTFFNHHPEIRLKLASLHKGSTWDEIEEVVKVIEETVESIFEKTENIDELDDIKIGELESWGGSYKQVAYWRLQPHFRKVDGVEGKDVIKQSIKEVEKSAEKNLKRKASDDDDDNQLRSVDDSKKVALSTVL
ncbi:hypothetical protein CANARDRAFT_27718 [[Candida] arabinofermentans NRRL YB-2248]|uniref:tRNA-dihydrouridine(16/17) synthase [NAD(P)(+)] n=1 Tax=[Candida] arabinofermentans NRRL YB-2248 TaxID=983967 RepID=A0A1E4T437_9ASCO|nr:hypothetical protein CANARDRAFT_27718 [[Candida] arabinofermentans NRRL YB-2248]